MNALETIVLELNSLRDKLDEFLRKCDPESRSQSQPSEPYMHHICDSLYQHALRTGSTILGDLSLRYSAGITLDDVLKESFDTRHMILDAMNAYVDAEYPNEFSDGIAERQFIIWKLLASLSDT